MSNSIVIKDEDSVVKAAKAVLAKVLDLEVGTTSFDLSFNLRGEVTKGEDYEQVIAQSVCPYTLLAVALNKLNGNTTDVVAGLVSEVGAMDDKERANLRASMKSATQGAMSSMGQSAVKFCSGKTTSKIEAVQVRSNQVEGSTAVQIAEKMGLEQESANG